jgi:hypothetical protein
VSQVVPNSKTEEGQLVTKLKKKKKEKKKVKKRHTLYNGQ